MTDSCPHPSVGSRCKQCEIERNAVADTEWFDCPNCGGDTSAPETMCFRCRGGRE